MEYIEHLIKIHQEAADNPAYEPWVRESNRQRVLALRRSRLIQQLQEEEECERLQAS